MKYGIYVHIPFCRKKCAYCDFVSVESSQEFQNKYVKALLREIEQNKDGAVSIDTLYIGGGTPSILEAKYIVDIVEALKKSFSFKCNEFTLECNPESVTKEKIAFWKKAGVNRISLGVQSLSDSVLALLGRVHTSAEALRALKLLCDNFERVSCDVMCALPNQTQELFLQDLHTLTAFPISHISAYQLILEEHTPLYQRVQTGEVIVPDDDFAADCYESAVDLLQEKGFFRYEISNFAKKGFESLHNIKYWKREPYLGFGAAAHSFDGNFRFANVSNPIEYVTNTEKGKSVLGMREKVEDALFESLMLGLRMAEGVDVVDIEKRFHIDFKTYFTSQIEELAPYCQLQEGRYFLRKQYFNLLNAILEKFL